MRAEEAARLSDETQAAYAAAEAREDTDWLEVTDALQKRVLREGGVPPARMAAALFALRAAAQLLPHEPELAAIPLYVRHNRAAQGSLRAGDAAPDVPLHAPRAGGPATTLRAACAAPRPTLLVAGSFT